MKSIEISKFISQEKIAKNLGRVILCLPLLLLLCLLQAHVATGQLRLEETFEDNNWNGNLEEQDGCPDCAQIVTPSFRARNGNKAMRIEWKRNLYNSGRRGTKGTEITTSRIPWEQEAWVGFSFYLPDQDPNGFKTDSKRNIIFQLMGYSACSPSNKSAAIGVVGNRLSFSRYDRNENIEDYTLSDNITRNRWHDVVLHFRTDLNSNNGFVEVWLDGDKKVPLQNNIQFGHGGACSGGTYLKFGTYQYESSDYANRVLYFDEVRYGIGNLGYAVVAPKGGTTPTPTPNPSPTPTPPPPATTIINEGFSQASDINNVNVQAGGLWQVTNGRLVLSNPAAGSGDTLGAANLATYETAVPAGDFTLTTEASAVNTTSEFNDFAVVFGLQDINNYYFVSFNETSSAGTGIYRVTNSISTRLDDIRTAIAAGQTYAVRVERRSAQIRVYLNDEQVATATDTMFTGGYVGFGTRNDAAAFDNLRVGR